MRPALVVGILVTTMLAGCAGDEAPSAQIQTCMEDTCQATVELNETVPDPLFIKGVVVDETITPVAGITVKLLQAKQTLAKVETGKNGAFKFDGLSNGFYRLIAEGPDHGRGEVQVDLQPDAPETVRMQVIADPVIVPIHNLVQWDGFISCSTYLGILYSSGGCAGLSIITGTNRTHDWWRPFWDELMEPGIPPSWIQAELYWEPNQVVGEALWMTNYLYHPDEPRGDWLPYAEGRSPLMLSYDAGMIDRYGLGGATNASMPHGILYQIWAGGEGITDISIMIEQPFTMYFSTFYHQTPPPGWMFVTDGEL